MGAETGIAWTDHTFNPWWGCQRVSPGCTNCYAETWDRRWGGEHWGPTAERRFFGDAHWNEPLKWNKAAEQEGRRARVFCASMADVFEDRRDLDAQRGRLWTLIRQTPHLDWQILTKRPENIADFVPAHWLPYPPRNVWFGTSVEDRARKERIDMLTLVPAHTRFLSVEPLLEDLGTLVLDGIHWMIVGGESGGGARPMEDTWALSLKAQCEAAGVAFFMKQRGGVKDKRDDPEKWPEALRVREFPPTAAAGRPSDPVSALPPKGLG